METVVQCPICNQIYDKIPNKTNYCPICGEKMVELIPKFVSGIGTLYIEKEN